MKKFAIFLTGLLLAFIAVNFLYIFLLPKVDWDFGKTKEAADFKGKAFKIIVFGNSTVMDGVNTEMLTEKFGESYNFALAGASLESNYIQLEKYLQLNEKPGKVLLFLSSAHTNYLKIAGTHPIVEYYYGNPLQIKKLEDIPLFKFRWMFVENFKKLLSADHRSAHVVKGQLRINKIIPDNSGKNVKADSCYNSSFYFSEGYQSMWKMAVICKKAGIEMDVFEMPCWNDMQNNCPDINLNRLVEETDCNLYIHNLNNNAICDTMLNPKKDWLSRNHLNFYGSQNFTSQVIRVLSH